MKQEDITVGATYVTNIGGEPARVVVVGAANPPPGSRGIRYYVRREAEDRVLPKLRTAAALRRPGKLGL